MFNVETWGPEFIRRLKPQTKARRTAVTIDGTLMRVWEASVKGLSVAYFWASRWLATVPHSCSEISPRLSSLVKLVVFREASRVRFYRVPRTGGSAGQVWSAGTVVPLRHRVRNLGDLQEARAGQAMR